MRLFAVVLIGAVLLVAVTPAVAAPSTPVIMLIMDEFPGAAIEGSDGLVARQRFPYLARFSQESVYYPNATTSADLTIRAIPSIISGQALETWRIERGQTVYDLVSDSYRLKRFENFADLPGLCSFCDQTALPVKQFGRAPLASGDLQDDSLRGILGTIEDLGSGDGQLWTGHLLLPHAPYRFLPSSYQYPLSEASKNPGITADKSVWYNNQYLPLLSKKRFLLQAGFVDRLFGHLRKRLITKGLWNKAMVIVVADHGSSFTPGTYRRVLENKNFAEIANVPLLIKYPNQYKGSIDTSSAQTIDLLATIADVVGRTITWPSDGRSLLESRPDRPVRVFGAYGVGWQELGFAEFIARRKRLVNLWNRDFPGNPASVWIGPRSDLRDRPLADIQITKGRMKAVVENAASFTAHRGSTQTHKPMLLSGTLRYGRSGLPLVASVNGRIVSSGWSYRVGPQVRFTLLLPEDKLRRSGNRVKLFLSRPNGLQALLF